MIETEDTKIPVCPWCGIGQVNYENFYLPDRQTICCKEDTHNRFCVLRSKETPYKYTTYKIGEAKVN